MPSRISPKRDHSTLPAKVAMRCALLDTLPRPLHILEAFGGTGQLWKHCYDVPGVSGVVIERHPTKADILARQRGHWIVVQGDCVALLSHGLCAWMPFDLLDLDAHGSPLMALSAIFAHPRPFAATLWIVATDGTGFALRRGAIPVTHYPAILHEWLEQLAAVHHRTLSSWRWRVAGSAGPLYHWMACLQQIELEHGRPQ